MKRSSIAVILLLMPLLFAQAQAGSVSDSEAAIQAILRKATLFGAGNAIQALFDMVTTSSAGEKTRQVELFYDRTDVRTRILARIVEPTFLSGMKFLKIRQDGKPDAQWLKTSSGLRRLGESDRSEKIFGSTFTVEDFGSLDSGGFTLRFAPEMDFDTNIAILAIPKNKVGYAKKVIWIEHSTCLVIAVEYRGSTDTVLRNYRVTRRSPDDGRPQEAIMTDHETKTSTILRIVSIQEKQAIPEKYFNPGAL